MICSICHCEERSDEAISHNLVIRRDCFTLLAMTIVNEGKLI